MCNAHLRARLASAYGKGPSSASSPFVPAMLSQPVPASLPEFGLGTPSQCSPIGIPREPCVLASASLPSAARPLVEPWTALRYRRAASSSYEKSAICVKNRLGGV